MSETQTNNKYRATFILDTRGYEDPVETLIEKLSSTLAAIDCEVEKVENLGQKEFVRDTARENLQTDCPPDVARNSGSLVRFPISITLLNDAILFFSF